MRLNFCGQSRLTSIVAIRTYSIRAICVSLSKQCDVKRKWLTDVYSNNKSEKEKKRFSDKEGKCAHLSILVNFWVGLI